jgi:Cu/Ag efflux pump CusA
MVISSTVDREAGAQYGQRVQDVNGTIESAIGGKTITTTVEAASAIRLMRAIFAKISMGLSAC